MIDKENLEKYSDEEIIEVLEKKRTDYTPEAIIIFESILTEREYSKDNLENYKIHFNNNLVFQYNVVLKNASIFARFLNCIIDMSIIKFICIPFILDKILIYFVDINTWSKNEITFRGILILIPYYIIFELLISKTPGKFITKTKVVTTNNKKPTFYSILIRSFVRIIPVFDALSFLVFKEGFHDSWSETKVVKD